jgi:ABC-2 type transport system ATP-binding protein
MDVVLKAESLCKKFGNVVAVDQISFEVLRGEIFGFLGPNGAGKTTSIKIMSGLLKPNSGRVLLNLPDHRASIGICPQHIVIWENLTCLEQLVYMGKMYRMSTADARTRALEILTDFGLTEKKDKLAKTLSGGMQRRLNIALALVHSPALVFLDEPQAGLDPQSRILVRDFIRSLKKDSTVILTTHDMEEAEKLSDRICIIDQGKLLAMGTTDEIKKTSGQEDLIEIQIQGDIRRQLIPFLKKGSTGYEVLDDSSACFKISDPFSTLDDIISIVKRQNITVVDLRLRKKSLEDIFIAMTGRRLRE